LYKVENDSTESEKCKLDILITKKDKEYEYELKSEERKLNGKISLKLNENRDGYYFTLEGIEWSEYEGNIDEVNETENNQLDLPIGIQGSLYENKISIQNYGNSTNYYVQLSDCGKKYIHFIKK
jgi:phosphoenolpyruvate synthase/pyruvate phosphate dikinase